MKSFSLQTQNNFYAMFFLHWEVSALTETEAYCDPKYFKLSLNWNEAKNKSMFIMSEQTHKLSFL